jgi:hypothetical protein
MNALPPQSTLLSLSNRVPPPPERREDDREHVLLRMAHLLLADRRELCLIRNVSAGGALIRTYSTLEVGDALAIELRPGDSISGIVRWSKGSLAGVMFTQFVDTVQLLADSTDWPRPRQPRVEIAGTAWMQVDGRTYLAEPLDLSQGGSKVRSKAPLEQATEAVINLRGLPPLPVRIRWSQGDLHGLEFSETLPLTDLVRWVRAHREDIALRRTG